jgi:putative oxidoreductase
MALKFRSRAERRPQLTGREHEVRPASREPRRSAPAMSSLERAAQLAGRVIFGGYFLYSGIHHFTDRDMLIGYARSKGVPYPEAAVLGTGALLVLGGVSLLAGRQKTGASLITTFLAGVTPMMHDFWNQSDQGQRMNDAINFGKNIALIGGAAFAAAASHR